MCSDFSEDSVEYCVPSSRVRGTGEVTAEDERLQSPVIENDFGTIVTDRTCIVLVSWRCRTHDANPVQKRS